jgi:hypothetical protein
MQRQGANKGEMHLSKLGQQMPGKQVLVLVLVLVLVQVMVLVLVLVLVLVKGGPSVLRAEALWGESCWIWGTEQSRHQGNYEYPPSRSISIWPCFLAFWPRSSCSCSALRSAAF